MKKTVCLILTFMMILSSVCVFANFNDIDSVTQSWAGEAIASLFDKGIINGYGDGTFRPEGNVTRAEFAKMLCLSFKSAASQKDFDDISSHWAESYINSAAAFMYTPDESFLPDSDATRADIAYAVSAALELVPSDASIPESLKDFDLVHEGMKDKVAAAIESKIIIGYEDFTLRPQNPVTRAEAAVIIFRALNMYTSDKEDIPETDETPDENIKPENPPADENPNINTEHMYTLYPGKNLMLVKSVTSMLDEKGEDCYRISYLLADTGEEFSSVLPQNIEVKGVKTALSSLNAGDVLMMDTAFHGYIDCLYVLASFKESIPAFSQTVAGYRDYSFSSGKITDFVSSNKAVTVTLDTGTETKEEVLLKNTQTFLYSQSARSGRWEIGDIGDLKPDTEDIYVFIRYEDGVSKEVVATVIE